MRSLKSFLLPVIAIALLVIVKLIFFRQPSNTSQTPKGQLPTLKVNAIRAISEMTEEQFFVTGSLLANEEVDLRTEASGKVTKILFQEGSMVETGELLVKINDADLVAQLKKLQQQEVLAMEKDERMKKLLAIHGISQEEYDVSLSQLNSTHADKEIVLAQIAKTEIHAPFHGRIGLRYVSEGSYVSPATRIAVIEQTDPIKIDFSIPEKYAINIHRDTPIRFSVEGSQAVYDASVSAVEPRVDIATRTVQVRAVCPNKEGKLMPGGFARVEFNFHQQQNSMMIPSEALVPILKGYKIFILKNGVAEESKIITGLRTEKKVQVLEGLQEGDTVITSGIMQLKKGSPVKVEHLQ